MRVKEWKDTIVFLHEVAPGAADRSYGIQVAKLAGSAQGGDRTRAREVLRALEDGREGHKPLARIDDLPLFADALKSAKACPARRARSKTRCAPPIPMRSPPRARSELVYALKRLLAEASVNKKRFPPKCPDRRRNASTKTCISCECNGKRAR